MDDADTDVLLYRMRCLEGECGKPLLATPGALSKWPRCPFCGGSLRCIGAIGPAGEVE